MRYQIVDVFSATPLAGNALCVVLDACPDARMSALAREVNLSETTFPTLTAPSAYRMRIFTPHDELPFAGHPSIGTAWVLGPGSWQQTTEGATVRIDADASGAVMSQPDPDIVDAEPDGVAAAIGVGGLEGAFLASAGGNRFLLAATSDDLGRAKPDHRALDAIAARGTLTGVAAIRRVDDATLHVRVFAPGAGIAEDAGTGGVAGAVGVLARRHWGTHVDTTIRQGDEIGRPCRIEVHAQEGAVRVGGAVVRSAEGRFLL